MSDLAFVKQWVCLLREGAYDVNDNNGELWVITREDLVSMAKTFNGPKLVAVNTTASMGAPPEAPGNLPTFSGAGITAVEVRDDERGAYLAGYFRTPALSISFVRASRNPITGVLTGPRLVDVMFTSEKLQPKISTPRG